MINPQRENGNIVNTCEPTEEIMQYNIIRLRLLHQLRHTTDTQGECQWMYATISHSVRGVFSISRNHLNYLIVKIDTFSQPSEENV